MRIVLDAMGSDNAPEPEIQGAVEACQGSPDIEIILVGDESVLKRGLSAYPPQKNISIVHAEERVLMDDSPAQAVRKKKSSSLLVGLRLVKEGEADAFLSAGNTGAVMLGSRVVLGPIPGVRRSAICQILPTLDQKGVVVLDLGANVDCNAEHLCQFAEMGQVFSQLNLGIKRPRVGLVNIGEEQAKGNDIAKAVHRNLTAAEHINFVGNIEPKALFAGKADVAICDGFIGNIILKTSESVAGLMKNMLEREMRSSFLNTVGALLSRNAFRTLKSEIDPNESTGAPLLGVNGIVIIVHGSCAPSAIKNALIGAKKEFELGLNEHIQKGIAELRKEVEAIKSEETA